MSCLQYGGFHGRPLFLDCTIQIITPFLDCTTQNLQEPGPSSHGGAGQSGRPKPAWRSQRAGEPRRGSALRGYGDFVRTKRNGGFKARAGFAKCWHLPALLPIPPPRPPISDCIMSKTGSRWHDDLQRVSSITAQ